MSLNRFLCKHFDYENRGYVTIGSIIIKCVDVVFSEEILTLICLTFLLPFLIGGLILTVIFNPNGVADIELIHILYCWLVGIMVYALVYLVYKILTLKIAKCPLKEQKKED